jgi:hypothetical protein
MPNKTHKPTSDSAAPSDEDSRTALDQRRGKFQLAQEAATRAENRVTELDRQLEANAAQYRADKAALQEAIDRQSELKKGIKASAKQRDDMREARKSAGHVAEEARRRAHTAEAKYEKALLVDMLREQKSKDLSGETKPVKAGGTVAKSTARKTAAAATARKARS